MGKKLSLVKPSCTRETCRLFGQVHPRCTAHNRSGGPCGQVCLKGQFVCRTHGGKTGKALAVGERRIALLAAGKMGEALFAFNAEDPETPEEGLLRQVRWSGQITYALGEAVRELSKEEAVEKTPSGARLHVLIEALAQERERHARFCKLAIDAGIEQKQLDLAQTQARIVVGAMLALLTSKELGLTAEQIIKGRVAAAEILRSLSPKPMELTS